ncbi:Hint domain-containing protein [Asaia astilbis]|uniref:Hint domain-containing protein n=1 Tax=Asaia astilbis TaxID=610244 RepID=UPI000471E7F4|nr:Hint domain-containing protein [Asaia astilbis]
MPSEIFANGSYVLSGSYFTVTDGVGYIKPNDPEKNVDATIDGFWITFDSVNSPGTTVRWEYDYSWGNKDIGILILGDTAGAYHVIVMGNTNFDWSSLSITYTGEGESTGESNFFTVTYEGVSYDFTQDSTGTAPVSFTPCYLAGSLVKTTKGFENIEDIKPGDMVLTYEGDVELPARVMWVGASFVKVLEGPHDDMAGYPVTVCKGALGDNVPFENLSVTSEHCIVIDDKFIPVRMLVNGKSIFYDKSQVSFTVFHILTERHRVINVNGVLSETYLLNDKSSWKFSVQKGISLSSVEAMSWQEDAAVPLCCERGFVEPIWKKLSERAKEDLS